MTAIIMKQPERPNDKDHNVKIVNTAACPKELWVAFEERFGVKIKEAYGATDGGGFMTLQLRLKAFNQRGIETLQHSQRRELTFP